MSTSVERVEGSIVGPKTVRLKVRNHEIFCDKPEDMGGSDQGPMASEYLLGALASCMTTTAHRIGEIRSVTFTRLDTAAEMHFDGDKVTGIRLEIRAASPQDAAAVRKVFDLAERACTISKLLSMPVTREVSIS